MSGKVGKRKAGVPAITPAMIPSEVVSALGDWLVFGRRRMRRDRVSSSTCQFHYDPVQLTESIVHPVCHCYPEKTAAQPLIQAGETLLLDGLRDGLSDGLQSLAVYFESSGHD